MSVYDSRVERQMVNFYGSLSEKDRRRYAAVEAAKLGHGGQAYIAGLFGCDPETIAVGAQDVELLPADVAAGRVRKKREVARKLAWRIRVGSSAAEAVRDHTAGSPVEPDQLWTNRSPAELARELAEQGHAVDPKTVQGMLKEELGLSRRQMVKTLSMGASADRDAQFQELHKIKAEFLEQGLPVLSVDTKKKELLGRFYRKGPAWTNGRVRAWDHDFPSSAWGKVIPYGVLDGSQRIADVFGQGSDTGQLAADAVRRWWHRLGKWHYPADAPLLLLADCGGSNGYRVPLFREQLQPGQSAWQGDTRLPSSAVLLQI